MRARAAPDKEAASFLNFVLDASNLRRSGSSRTRTLSLASPDPFAGMYRSDADRAVETVFREARFNSLDRGRVRPRRFLSLCISTARSLRAGNAHEVLPGFSWTIM